MLNDCFDEPDNKMLMHLSGTSLFDSARTVTGRLRNRRSSQSSRRPKGQRRNPIVSSSGSPGGAYSSSLNSAMSRWVPDTMTRSSRRRTVSAVA